jgi:hypothetical protein
MTHTPSLDPGRWTASDGWPRITEDQMSNWIKLADDHYVNLDHAMTVGFFEGKATVLSVNDDQTNPAVFSDPTKVNRLRNELDRLSGAKVPMPGKGE